ncbi:cupin domain-containing protein [Kushneria sp. EE4]
MKKPQTLFFQDDGNIPNSAYPTLVYRAMIADSGQTLVDMFEALFQQNDWPVQWRGGVFDYHHFHSTAHEVLGVYAGAATLRLGGERGEDIEVSAGDVIVLPAGTGHCRISASNDFAVTAGYPRGQSDWDICRSGDNTPAVKARIASLSRPALDPVAGEAGGVASDWR